ncbi:MAG: hypothetical protein JSS44_03810 [Proteobacteria bacterium]|nr:hypothetical protein [Pseudomonadota bacterium]
MTAGTAATRVNTETSADSSCAKLPYAPRKLSRAERNRRELFVYHSPRNDRIVTVSEILLLALALKLEFDSKLVAYVERPRRIALKPHQEIDVSFWTRSRSGEERYYLAIPASGTVRSTCGSASIRDRELLDEAATRHGLTLTCVTEAEMVSALADCRVAFELLPHVWAYKRLIVRSSIRAQIQALLATTPRTTLVQLFKQLEFQPDAIRAVVAGMIHEGTLRLVDYVAGNGTVTVEVAHA